MADKVHPDKEKARRDLEKAKARMAAMQKQWADASEGRPGAYGALPKASEWVAQGWWEDTTARKGDKGKDREKLRDEKMPDGRTREQWIHEWRQLQATVTQISEVEYPEMSDSKLDVNEQTQTTVDDKGRIIQKDPVTGKATAYDPATGKDIVGFDPGAMGGVESLDGPPPRALTNDDLEDIWRTSNPDITPDNLAQLYPEYDANGLQINEANPLAFSKTDMIRWDENPNYDAQRARAEIYDREVRRVLGERRPTTSPSGSRQGSPSGRAAHPVPAMAGTAGGRRGSPGQSAAVVREATRRSGATRTDILAGKEITYSFREAFNLPFTWSSTEVAQMATRLFMAGYMPQLMGSYDPTKPLSQQYPGGLGDPYNMAFRTAYMDWMKDSMANRDKTSMQILAEREKATGGYFSEMRRVAEEEKAKEIARRIASYTQLTDPDRINSLVDQLGQALIGRKLSPGEKAQYVSMIHSQQSAYGTARAHAEVEGTSLSQTEVDVQATLEASIRGDNPVEAMGKDVADQYNEFRKLLGGPLAMM